MSRPGVLHGTQSHSGGGHKQKFVMMWSSHTYSMYVANAYFRASSVLMMCWSGVGQRMQKLAKPTFHPGDKMSAIHMRHHSGYMPMECCDVYTYAERIICTCVARIESLCTFCVLSHVRRSSIQTYAHIWMFTCRHTHRYLHVRHSRSLDTE